MGIVLWEVLSRKRLFRGENDGETLDRVQQMEPPALAEISPHLGAAAADLDAVIAKALAKDPEKRLLGVDALAAELEKVVRAHDLGATHGDVRDAFAPALTTELDDRRRRVQAAASGQAPSPSQPPPSVNRAAAAEAVTRSENGRVIPSNTPPALSTSSTTPSVSPSKPVPRVLIASIGAVALVAIAAISVFLSRSDERAATPHATATREPASEIEPLSGSAEVRARATPSDEPIASASAGAPSSRPRTGGRPSRPTSDEPGKKPPRPNPYASSSPPR